MSFNIYSETGSLKTILIHSPLGEHKFLSKINTQQWLDMPLKTNNPDYLLFDNVIDTQLIIKEHNQLKVLLDVQVGSNNILTFYNLLSDILDFDFIKHEIIQKVIECELKLYNNNINNKNLLIDKLSNNDLAFTLITGRLPNGNILFKYPLPNLIFTRDIGAVIGNTLITTWSWHPSRRRESIITQFIFNHHSIFKEHNIYHFQVNNPELSIEGGDIIIFNDKIVLIGISQRTSLESIKALLPLIFNNGFEKVFAIDLPKQRNFMHLDTVFTRISDNECLVYPPLFNNINNHQIIYSFEKNKDENNSKPIKDNLHTILQKEGFDMNFIPSGGIVRKNQDNELNSLGANVFALSPGKIVGYLRNSFTINELEKNGYSNYSAEVYIKRFNEFNDPENKCFIYIDETELSRGHGGIRCLTLPLVRSNNVN